MKRLSLIIFILVTIVLTGCSRWTPLFEGDSFDGWQSVNGDFFPEVGWSLKDGILISNPEGVRGGDIMTRKVYGDFILSAEFKLTPLSNSGIKYFINPGTFDDPSIGCEYQIIDDKDFSEQVEFLEDDRLTGALYDILPADKSKAGFKSDSWNKMKIKVRGGLVEHYLNGVKIVEYDRFSKEFDVAVAKSKFASREGFGKFQTGHILIQDHDNSVHFRNIRIKETH
ncbi:MAG: DUF1080 domain-containing protein [Bacteroidales bacterium]|jgi:hypothetical protein|nr:DUF1080 domain-containing protein [Bacteroidales bacterium]